ncbi:Protein ALWAYS EARLY 2 [Glycine soja]|uniref:Protein ALWAYS EARLY 2 n=1 Tax=Glycine soja TaxID=3848 RepID=A0A445LG90_GLYSO|nr:Protein ALWAYS EARLY 2 [Glycine soja]
MAPTKKPRTMKNKRFSSEVSTKKDEVGSSKNKQRKKNMSDELGPKWKAGELNQFYEAYRKHGKDWTKVAEIVSSRSAKMVEALYNISKAYLSLPKESASAVGLIAMITDHYSMVEESDSERERNDVPGSRQPMKRKCGKIQLSISNDSVQSQSIASKDGCLSLLKKRQFDGIPPWPVAKRTPRFPVNDSKPDDRENYVLPNKRNPKSMFDANDDEAAHVVTMASTEAAQRGVSPRVSQNPYKKSKQEFSLVQSGQIMHQESETVPAKFYDASIDEEYLKDKSSSMDALLTLADMCLLVSTSTMESESSVQLKEEKMAHKKDEKSVLPEGKSTRQNRDKIKLQGLKQKVDHAVPGVGSSTKHRSRRKTILQRPFTPKEKSSEKILKSKQNKNLTPVHGGALNILVGTYQEKLSGCLSSYMVRRWCMFEWFYSAIDYPWFSKREFMEYLNHVDLGRIPRLTRVEWSVIRSSLGKPRRFSERFLHGERQKLEQYRESVRKYYDELRTGIRDGLPTDLSKPLCVGQRVIAFHSKKTREIHDGSVLTVDHDNYRVQFDRPELGVDSVMDIDCMPLNPLDTMPETLRQQISASNVPRISKKPHKKGNSRFGGNMTYNSSGPVEKAPTSSSTLALAKPKKALSPGKLLLELKNANSEIVGNQNDADCFNDRRLSRSITPHVIQLKEASGQVFNALCYSRKHNTEHIRNSPPPQMNPKASFDNHDSLPNTMDGSLVQELGSAVEIIKGSKLRAHAMVDAAFQALSSTKEGEDALTRIEQALDCADNQQLATNSRLPVIRSQGQISGSFDYHNRSISHPSKPLLNNASGRKLHNDSDKVNTQILLDLITSCVATGITIQTCANQQCPPADVTPIFDTAVTILHPRSLRNFHVYRDIQMHMQRIKSQILAHINN